MSPSIIDELGVAGGGVGGLLVPIHQFGEEGWHGNTIQMMLEGKRYFSPRFYKENEDSVCVCVCVEVQRQACPENLELCRCVCAQEMVITAFTCPYKESSTHAHTHRHIHLSDLMSVHLCCVSVCAFDCVALDVSSWYALLFFPPRKSICRLVGQLFPSTLLPPPSFMHSHMHTHKHSQSQVELQVAQRSHGCRAGGEH